jgi:hypothetical protein
VFNAVTSGGVMIGVLLVWYFLVDWTSLHSNDYMQ